ncbi:MAG: hypothetical protein NVS1B6_10360 [Steroidobacteraceae bacterium]
MARKRSLGRLPRQRQSQRIRLRTEPERPTLLISTLPFFALLAVLGILAVAIMIVAFPGSQPLTRTGTIVPKELGVAQRGWFQEAQKDMH